MSELEVIQELFRGRVDELERNERSAKEAAKLKAEEAQRLQMDLEAATSRITELEQKLAAAHGQESPSRKRSRRNSSADASTND